MEMEIHMMDRTQISPDHYSLDDMIYYDISIVGCTLFDFSSGHHTPEIGTRASPHRMACRKSERLRLLIVGSNLE
jgi:hypothetical protein